MFAISERGSEEDQDGYLSDPNPVQNEKDLIKLYKVVPKLKNGPNFPIPLRDIKQKQFKSLERLSSPSDQDHIDWEKELQNSHRVDIDSLAVADKDDGEGSMQVPKTQFSSEHRPSLHNNLFE